MGSGPLVASRSTDAYRRALGLIPGGVNSPVRAMRSIGRDPLFVERAAGAEITDVDGNVYVDYVCSWGPLIHGHAHPVVLEAIAGAAALGTTFGAATAGEHVPCPAVQLGRADVRQRRGQARSSSHRRKSSVK